MPGDSLRIASLTALRVIMPGGKAVAVL